MLRVDFVERDSLYEETEMHSTEHVLDSLFSEYLPRLITKVYELRTFQTMIHLGNLKVEPHAATIALKSL